MRFFFVLVVLAYLAVAVSGAGVSWDGSYLLFRILESQTPFLTQNGQLLVVPLHWATILVSRFTSNPIALQTAFGLSYALVPILALAACWWMVRNRAQPLFVWATLGIALGTLPGQIFLVGEAALAVQSFWPVLLGILTRMPRAHLPIIALFTAATFFSHPNAVLLLGLGSGLAFFMGVRHRQDRAWIWTRVGDHVLVLTKDGVRHRQDRAWMWAWAGIFAVLCAMDARWFGVSPQAFAAEQILPTAATGLSQVAVICGWLVALMAFVVSLAMKRSRPGYLQLLLSLELATVVAAAVLLLAWSGRYQLWNDALKFRSFVLLSSVPFITIAALEALIRDPGTLRDARKDWRHRARTIQVIGVVFFLVLTIQSVSWQGLTAKLAQAINESPYSCISASSIPQLDTSPLNHWSITVYSLLLQGQRPQKVVEEGDTCIDGQFADGLFLASFDTHSWAGGWFDFQPLYQRLVDGAVAARSCQFVPTSGWYWTEEYTPLRQEWRWSGGQGELNVVVDRDTEATLSGDVRSAQQPNDMDVLVNGTRQATQEITWDGFKPVGPLPISLYHGTNMLEVVSRNPGAPIPDDARDLAVAVRRLTVTIDGEAISCE